MEDGLTIGDAPLKRYVEDVDETNKEGDVLEDEELELDLEVEEVNLGHDGVTSIRDDKMITTPVSYEPERAIEANPFLVPMDLTTLETTFEGLTGTTDSDAMVRPKVVIALPRVQTPPGLHCRLAARTTPRIAPPTVSEEMLAAAMPACTLLEEGDVVVKWPKSV